MKNHELPLLVLKAFVKGLSHELRSPLSTISNELFALGKLYSSKDYELCQQKCIEISETLDCFNSWNSINLQVVKLNELLEKLNLQASDSSDVKVYTDIENLKSSYETIITFIKNYLVNQIDANIDTFSKTGTDSIVISVRFNSNSKLEQQYTYGSLTEFCLNHLNLDAHVLAKNETMLWAIDAKMRFTYCDVCHYLIELPVTNEQVTLHSNS